ncbi:MAG: ATP-binding protein [Oculatellaceae cyanobacterium bins.114]|nr:ATP-binding protein [Oculatellaceae cyanobacterium bins.114]
MTAREAFIQASLLNRMTHRIRQSLDLTEILSATVAEVRSFLQTDRVKVYRFQPDGTGQVIAEAIHNNRLPSLLGLHFPSTDIPPAARELFVKARQRSIVSIPDQLITLSRLPDAVTTGSLTLEALQHYSMAEILQRPVDPCHVDYLTAMGVQSSLVVPILHGQTLWGLLVSHHVEPKTFSEPALQTMQLLADQVSIAIAQSEVLSQTRNKAYREALINQISTLLHAPLRIQNVLQMVLERIVQASQATGGRLYLSLNEGEAVHELYTCGTQPNVIGPDGATLEQYSLWKEIITSDRLPFQTVDEMNAWTELMAANENNITLLQSNGLHAPEAIADLYQDQRLYDVVPLFRSTPIRSIMLMPLQHGHFSLGCLTIFRNEIDTDIVWAGQHNGDWRTNRVRLSFAAWRELKQGQAQEWTEHDIELVRSLGTHLTLAVMQRRLYQCEREQRLLVEMRNQELQNARVTAEEASRLKSNFLSSTSHELRTPLASMLNYLKLLNEGFYNDEAELKEYVHIAYRSAENLVALINDVLDIAKVEAGRMPVTLETIDLPSLLTEQEMLFRPESHRTGIPLIIECGVGTISSDPVKLRQILTNLLSNAFKFTEQGEIRIRATQRIVLSNSLNGVMLINSPNGENAAPQVVEISVSDTGIGVNAQKREWLFEPFVQADGSIKRRYGGTGLGLTICKRLVELMGGQIWLDSPGKGHGTTVTFTLPKIKTF